MYTKNYFEMKSAITDGLNEFCESRPRPKNEKNKRISYSEILKLLITILPIVSAIFTLLFKFISLSSVWYYQFDFNYYDFSLSKIDLFLFIYTIVSALSGIIIALINSYISRQIFKKSKKRTFLLELLANILIAFIIYIFISLIILDLFKFEIMFGLFVIISIFSYGITFMFLPNNDSIKKSFKLFVVISIILVIVFTCLLFKYGYTTVKENTEFQIISYTDTFSKNEDLYVVISESEDDFSAYKCEIDENGLTVYTNYHKFFDNSTDYEVYNFENIDYIQKKKEYNGEKYEYVTEKYNIEPIEK